MEEEEQEGDGVTSYLLKAINWSGETFNRRCVLVRMEETREVRVDFLLELREVMA